MGSPRNKGILNRFVKQPIVFECHRETYISENATKCNATLHGVSYTVRFSQDPGLGSYLPQSMCLCACVLMYLCGWVAGASRDPGIVAICFLLCRENLKGNHRSPFHCFSGKRCILPIDNKSCFNFEKSIEILLE